MLNVLVLAAADSDDARKKQTAALVARLEGYFVVRWSSPLHSGGTHGIGPEEADAVVLDLGGEYALGMDEVALLCETRAPVFAVNEPVDQSVDFLDSKGFSTTDELLNALALRAFAQPDFAGILAAQANKDQAACRELIVRAVGAQVGAALRPNQDGDPLEHLSALVRDARPAQAQAQAQAGRPAAAWNGPALLRPDRVEDGLTAVGRYAAEGFVFGWHWEGATRRILVTDAEGRQHALNNVRDAAYWAAALCANGDHAAQALDPAAVVKGLDARPSGVAVLDFVFRRHPAKGPGVVDVRHTAAGDPGEWMSFADLAAACRYARLAHHRRAWRERQGRRAAPESPDAPT